MRILTAKQVSERIGVGRVTLWRMERAGNFPQRRQISPNRIGWLESEINDWLESRPVVGRVAE